MYVCWNGEPQALDSSIGFEVQLRFGWSTCAYCLNSIFGLSLSIRYPGRFDAVKGMCSGGRIAIAAQRMGAPHRVDVGRHGIPKKAATLNGSPRRGAAGMNGAQLDVIYTAITTA